MKCAVNEQTLLRRVTPQILTLFSGPFNTLIPEQLSVLCEPTDELALLQECSVL
jgi:hypothetical protein